MSGTMTTGRRRRQQPVAGPATGGRSLESVLIWGAVAAVGAVCWDGPRPGPRRDGLRAVDAVRRAVPPTRSPTASTRGSSPTGCWGSTTRGPPRPSGCENGVDFDVTDRRVLFGHHFAAIAGAGPLVGPGARGADGLPAGHDLDRRRRHLRRRGAGPRRHVLLDAPRRQEPRPDGPRGDRPRRRHRRPDRGLRHHDHHPGGARPGRRQRARRVAVGRVLHRADDPDRAVHGRLPAHDPARAGCSRPPRIGVVLLLLAIVGGGYVEDTRPRPTR